MFDWYLDCITMIGLQTNCEFIRDLPQNGNPRNFTLKGIVHKYKDRIYLS